MIYSALDYWNNQVNALNNRIRKLKRRRGEVESVKSELRSTAGSNSNDVNNKIRQAARRLDSAIEYSGKESRLYGILAGKSEQPASGDGYLSSADSAIQQEINDINRQLGEAESELRTAQGECSKARAAIAAEERRQREEAAQKAAKTVANMFKK